jgi:hypothetical protein
VDYLDWCGTVLRTLIDRYESDPRRGPVHENSLLFSLYGEEVVNTDGFRASKRFQALHSAMTDLVQLGAAAKEQLSGWWRPTALADEIIGDPSEVWARICEQSLKPEWAELLRVVNKLSVHTASDHAWTEWAEHGPLATELGWTDGPYRLRHVSEDLAKTGLIGRRSAGDAQVRLHATYTGLAWETKRGFTVESLFIDGLVAEWETTSVEFKRELRTRTKDEKAEFVKDIIGLANTQASGRRWLIVGFDDKTHMYYGPPDPKIEQNHLEQVLADYTDPVASIRYEVVDYRSGRVGKLEVLRDPKKLPYSVAKSVGDKKRIEVGDTFVRHGSQTEKPTQNEYEAIVSESHRAKLDH